MPSPGLFGPKEKKRVSPSSYVEKGVNKNSSHIELPRFRGGKPLKPGKFFYSFFVSFRIFYALEDRGAVRALEEP